MKGAYFARKPFKALSNIGLQIELTPWVGISWPVTPRHVAKVIPISRSSKVTSSFSGITFDRDQLKRWKHHRCVQADDMNRLICNMTFSDQVMTLTSGQIFNMTFQGQIIHHSTRLDKRNTMHAGKIKVVSLLSRKLWQKNVFRKKNGYFWSFSLWRPNRWNYIKSEEMIAKEL